MFLNVRGNLLILRPFSNMKLLWLFVCVLGGAAGFCSVTLLNEVVDTLEKSLNFMKQEVQNINLDGAFGCRVADGQLSYLLESLPSEFSSNFPQLSKKIQYLQRLAAEVADKAIGYLRENQPKYYHNMGPLLNSGQWHLRYPSRKVRSELRTEPLNCSEIPYTLGFSNQCMIEILGTNNERKKRCSISEQCWKGETSPRYKQYALTHQLLYLEIAETMGCLPQMNDKLLTEVAYLQDYFCVNILRDAEQIEKHGFHESEQDLFMEQIGLCGMLGYADMFKISWLKNIIKWQHPSGCFSNEMGLHWFCKDEYGAGKTRSKREEKKLRGNCLSHKTTVAIMALTENVRFCVQNLDLHH